MFHSREIREGLAELETAVAKIETALVVRDPGNARSADAFEGLRRSVVNAARARRQQLTQLVVLAEALERAESLDDVAVLSEQWNMEAGLQRWDVAEPPSFFQIIGGDEGRLVVDQPAWVDVGGDAEPVLIKPGIATRVPEVESTLPSEDAKPGDSDASLDTPSADGSAASNEDVVAPEEQGAGQ